MNPRKAKTILYPLRQTVRPSSKLGCMRVLRITRSFRDLLGVILTRQRLNRNGTRRNRAKVRLSRDNRGLGRVYRTRRPPKTNLRQRGRVINHRRRVRRPTTRNKKHVRRSMIMRTTILRQNRTVLRCRFPLPLNGRLMFSTTRRHKKESGVGTLVNNKRGMIDRKLLLTSDIMRVLLPLNRDRRLLLQRRKGTRVRLRVTVRRRRLLTRLHRDVTRVNAKNKFTTTPLIVNGTRCLHFLFDHRNIRSLIFVPFFSPYLFTRRFTIRHLRDPINRNLLRRRKRAGLAKEGRLGISINVNRHLRRVNNRTLINLRANARRKCLDRVNIALRHFDPRRITMVLRDNRHIIHVDNERNGRSILNTITTRQLRGRVRTGINLNGTERRLRNSAKTIQRASGHRPKRTFILNCALGRRFFRFHCLLSLNTKRQISAKACFRLCIMFFHRFCETVIRRLNAKNNRLRRLIVNSLIRLLHAHSLTKINNMSTIRINMGLTRVNARDNNCNRNANIQTTATRNNRVIMLIRTLRTNRRRGTLLIRLDTSTLKISPLSANEAMKQVNLRTNLPTWREGNQTARKVSNRNRRKGKGLLTNNRRRVLLALTNTKVSLHHLNSRIVNNVTLDKRRRRRVITLFVHVYSSAHRARRLLNVHRQTTTGFLRGWRALPSQWGGE